jgi:hypothetical protein
MKFNFDYEPQDLYKLFDYDTIDVLLKVKFWSGIYVVQTKVDMFYVDEGSLDPDVYELRDDEPVYIFKGINNWQEVDWEIQEVMEIVEWKS